MLLAASYLQIQMGTWRALARLTQCLLLDELNESTTIMFLLAIVTVLLSLLYGLAWHNEPAREPQVRRTNPEQEPHE